jgi:hypothetical protein
MVDKRTDKTQTFGELQQKGSIMKITIEFIGGHKDGSRHVGDTDHGPSFTKEEKDAFDAASFYDMFDKGRVGAACRGITDYAVGLMQTAQWETAKQIGHKARAEKYEVTERIETEDGVLVRATFVPESAE